jgi:TolB-like protein/Flp pilus assembly protein TadD
LIGDQVSHYRILERLGAGGMGEVFKAEDTRLGRQVALKFLPPELGRDSGAKARFIQEAKAASALDHENVCTIFDIGETEEGRLFLAMAYYEGTSLEDELAAGPLPVDRALDLAEQVAKGLAEAHGRGIVHRDIKPANLMISASGVVKIVDFGLAKLAEEPGMTKTGVVLGTPSYMSPEQARGEKADHRTDLWSLGVVLYEMLAGRRPFVGFSTDNILKAILVDEPEGVGTLRGGLVPDVERLVDRLMARSADDRCTSAREVLELIRSARQQQSTVSESMEETLVASGAAQSETALAGAPARLRPLWIVGVVVAALAAVGVWRLGTVEEGDQGSAPGSSLEVESSPPPPAKRVVAVLPFANLSANQENAFFADGVHEDILTHLSKVGGLTVLARTSVLRYRDTDKGIREIASELGADTVLGGSVRRAGDQIRISAQLIDTESEAHLWAESFDRRLDDVFAVQTEIARSVAEALQATLTPVQEGRLDGAPTDSLEAYDLYLRGRQAYYRDDEEANRTATRLFREALELDPQYALAWAGLAETFTQRALHFDDPEAWAESAVQTARKAIDLEPGAAEAHTALGNALSAQGRYEEALDAYSRAVELAPDHWPALNQGGRASYLLGRFDESIRLLRQAALHAPTELEPRWRLAHGYKFLRLDEEAVRWNDTVLVLDPDHVGARLFGSQLATYRGEPETALALVQQVVRDKPEEQYAWVGAAGMAYANRRYELAAQWAEKAIELAPESWDWYWHDPHTIRGISLLQMGKRKEALRVLEKPIERYGLLAAQEGGDPASSWHLAAIRGALGDGEAALQELLRAYDSGFRFARWPPIEPGFDALRDDPRYLELMANIAREVEAMGQRVLEQ